MVRQIAARTTLAGAKVVAMRRADMPDGATVTAILRYAV